MVSNSNSDTQNHQSRVKHSPPTPKILRMFLILWSPPADIHTLRPHPGQIEVALRFRSLLDSDHHPSQIAGQRIDPDSKNRSSTTLLVGCPFDSSVGRAEDCSGSMLRSLGRWFESGSKEEIFSYSDSADSAVHQLLKWLRARHGAPKCS